MNFPLEKVSGLPSVSYPYSNHGQNQEYHPYTHANKHGVFRNTP